MIIFFAAWCLSGLVAFALFTAAEVMLDLPHDNWWAYLIAAGLCILAGPLVVMPAIRAVRSASRGEEDDDA